MSFAHFAEYLKSHTLMLVLLRQIKRMLRVHLTTKALDQPWQLGDALKDVAAPPDSDAPGAPVVPTPEGGVDSGDATKATGSAPPNFKAGTGVPRFELNITGELLGVSGEAFPPFQLLS